MQKFLGEFTSVLLIVFLVGLAGCAPVGVVGEPIALVVPNLKNQSEGVKNWVKAKRRREGQWVMQSGRGTHFLLSLGPRHRPGFEVKFKGASRAGDEKLKLTFEIDRPIQDDGDTSAGEVYFPDKHVLVKPRFQEKQIIVEKNYSGLVKRLRKLKGKLENKTDGYRNRLEKMEVKLEQSRQSLQELQSRLEESEKSFAVLREEKESLRGKLRQSKRKTEDRGQEVERLRGRISELKKQVEEEAGKETGPPYIFSFDTGARKVTSVYFDSGHDTLKKDSRDRLTEVVGKNGGPADTLYVVVGFTDPVKVISENYRNNWDLSFRRAARVAEFLVSRELLDRKKLAIIGGGIYDSGDSVDENELSRKVSLYSMKKPSGWSF